MVDVANVKMLILLTLTLVMAVGVIAFLAGFCVGRYGRKGGKR
jgi:hypothetical protein